jgi:hypothetical protein
MGHPRRAPVLAWFAKSLLCMTLWGSERPAKVLRYRLPCRRSGRTRSDERRIPNVPMSTAAMRRCAAVLMTMLFGLAACDSLLEPAEPVAGSGVVSQEQRTSRGAAAVVLSAPGTLVIEQGDREGLHIEGEDNLLRHLRTRVEGRTLRVSVDPGVALRPTRPIRYHLVVRDLERIDLTSGGEVEARNLDLYRLTVFLTGPGDVNLYGLTADILSVTVTGSGGVRASGWTTEQQVTLRASGGYDAHALDTRLTEAALSGSGSATVRVRERLVASLSGSGSLQYYGTPQVQQAVTGSGRVRRLGR